MGRKLLKTVQTITTFRNPIADPVGTRRGPPLVRGPQFENRCPKWCSAFGVDMFATDKHPHQQIWDPSLIMASHVFEKLEYHLKLTFIKYDWIVAVA